MRALVALTAALCGGGCGSRGSKSDQSLSRGAGCRPALRVFGLISKTFANFLKFFWRKKSQDFISSSGEAGKAFRKKVENNFERWITRLVRR